MSVEQRLETPTTMISNKTPTTVKIRQHFSFKPLPVIEDASDNDEPPKDPLQELLKQTWDIHGVSPLFQFNYQSERHLKLYGKKLREEIASLLPKDDMKYSVKFEVDANIDPRPNATDPPAIKIQVFAENIEKETQKCLYTGILVSWGSSLVELDNENTVKLPLLLCRGNKTAIRAVHMTLARMFDCVIIQLLATEEDLRWLAPIILNFNDNEKDTKGLMKFEYKIPGLASSDDISFSWEISVLIKLWTAICENDMNDSFNGNDFTLPHVDRFYQILHKQILQDAGLQIGFSKLCKISLPYITIAENRMKASTSQVLNKVLLFFNEKATELLHLLNCDVSRNSNISN
ncbi:centromere protein L-like [Chelonus insularis]|uniref:centromere protein L-like n=1 Tax=Chelonus insularis TaxID=460826 RepID=UPI00158CF3F0|nr:centromere protein L-like [Chelonus insularis]